MLDDTTMNPSTPMLFDRIANRFDAKQPEAQKEVELDLTGANPAPEFADDAEERDGDDEDEGSSSADEMTAMPSSSPPSGNASDMRGAAGSLVSVGQAGMQWNKMMVARQAGGQSHEASFADPLAQLQSALERDGMLGMKLEPATVHGSLPLPVARYAADTDDVSGEVLSCHLCNYRGTSKSQFSAHMNSHFDHKCPFCDYTSRTEGRLKRHVKDFHSETPGSEPWHAALDDADEQDEKGSTKPRMHKCKQCNYVALNKGDFWEHSKGHIKKEKLLKCPNCPFVTEYKHHLEYHLRNHYGSKPFKCSKCNYKCVNKSMLNSHMKSHSNIYQYRCADCNYATKYCHSLKLHLRKYGHKPGPVLNLDGTPNPYPIIDVNGTRRGPRPKKPRNPDDGTSRAPHVSISLAMMNYREQNVTSLHLPGMGSPYLLPHTHTNMLNTFHKGFFSPTTVPATNASGPAVGVGLLALGNYISAKPLKCSQCDFSTDTQEAYAKHMMQHVARDNQDLCKLYGIGPDVLLHASQEMPSRTTSPNDECLPSRLQDTVDTSQAVLRDKINPMPSEAGNQESNRQGSDAVISGGCLSHVDATLADETSVFEQLPPTGAEHSVIVSSQSCEKTFPRAASSETADPHRPAAEQKPATSTASPLDLSSSNRSSPGAPPSDLASEFLTQSPGSPPRNRRKGKAFKLDRIRLKLQETTLEGIKQDTDDESTDNGEAGAERNGELSAASPAAPVPQPCNEMVAKRTSPGPSAILPSVLAAKIQAEVEEPCVPKAPGISSPPSQQYSVVQGAAGRCSSSYGSFAQPRVATLSSLHPPHLLQMANVQPAPECPPRPQGCKKDGEKAGECDRDKWKDAYMCTYCEMAFKDCVMYTMHMGYHGYQDPFTCNMCGQHNKDRLAFFLHIARVSHS